MSPAAQRQAKTDKAAAAQRRAAQPQTSVWVGASAGTGKTKVLTDRVLSLMLHGTPPERVLCLTFTKAAAAEMANRLAQRLAGWTALDEDELRAQLEALTGRAPDDAMVTAARQLFARVLDAPGGIKIQTIHAFCQALLGRFPLEAGVPPNFQVLDERSAQEMLQASRAEVMAAAQAPGGEALAEAVTGMTAHADEQTFLDLMAELIGERARFTRLMRDHQGIEGVLGRLHDLLGVAPELTAQDLLAPAVEDAAFDLAALKQVAAALAQGSKTDQERGAGLTAWLAADARERAARFQNYLNLYFTGGGDGELRKRLVTKKVAEAMPDAEAILTEEAERLAEVRDWLRRLAVAQATAALLRLGAAVLAAYGRHKRARGLLDYDDLILETRGLLRRQGLASWVLYKLDGGLDHLLIDEAQDTNPEQWQVIEALTAEFFAGEGASDSPRTVFAVGDAKQSIYSFQRADPDKFAEMRDHFASHAEAARLGWDRVNLEVSFRSTAAVLQAVDQAFASPEAQDGVLFGEARLRHDPVRVGQAGLVELWPAAEPEEGAATGEWEPPDARRGAAPPRARLARLIAERIHRWTTEPAAPGAWLESQARQLRPGDFLVLVRRRNEFVDELVRELKQREVPVAGVDRMVLTEQLAVMDLIALGQVLLLPEDNLTLATVLKGPLIGLSEEQLFDLAHDRKGSLWDALRRRAGTDPAFAAAAGTLATLQARADYQRPYELYGELLGAGRGREKLLARLGPEAADPLEEFLSLALAFERENLPSLQAFLHWIEAGAQSIKRDMEHGGDAVRVMTVHGAKGLQAPVVFLPDTLQVPMAPRGIFWLEEAGGLALWPVRKAYDGVLAAGARAAAAQVQAKEYRRLLYVAMTRAEDRLYICGWHTKKTAPEDCWYEMVRAALPAVAEEVDFDFTAEMDDDGWAGPGLRLATVQGAAPEAKDDEPFERGTPQPLPPWASTLPEPEPAPPRPLAPSRPASEAPAVTSPLGPDGGARFRRGLIVHRLLQSLPDLAPPARAAAARRYLALPVHGLNAGAQAQILGETLAVLEHPDFAPLFGPGSRAEVALTGTIEGARGLEVVSGQIDRLLVTPEAVKVVDYKTNRPAPRDPDQVAPLYLGQMATYRAVLKEIYPGRRIESYLLWTEDPRIMQLSDDLLAGHAP